MKIDPLKVRKKLEELAGVTKDLEANLKMLAKAPNLVAAEQLKKRVTELTQAQNYLMGGLVSLHPSRERQQEYYQVARRVEELPLEIKACQGVEQLRDLEMSVEESTDRLIHCFQSILAELLGGKAPEQPLFHNNQE